VTGRAFQVRKDAPLGETHRVDDGSIAPNNDMRVEPGYEMTEALDRARTNDDSKNFDGSDDLPEHVQCRMDTLPGDITDIQRDKVKEFSVRNADVFFEE